jgi:hypothetical protein
MAIVCYSIGVKLPKTQPAVGTVGVRSTRLVWLKPIKTNTRAIGDTRLTSAVGAVGRYAII